MHEWALQLALTIVWALRDLVIPAALDCTADVWWAGFDINNVILAVQNSDLFEDFLKSQLRIQIEAKSKWTIVPTSTEDKWVNRCILCVAMAHPAWQLARLFSEKNKTNLHFRKSKMCLVGRRWGREKATRYNLTPFWEMLVKILDSPLDSKTFESRNCLLFVSTSLGHAQHSTKHTADV